MKSHNSSEFGASLVNGLVNLADAVRLIEGGAALAVAGPEQALDQLPRGNWIGGTTPYFMTDEGGRIVSGDQVFVTDLSLIGTARIASYDKDELARISGDAPDNGFALAILPAMSRVHERFALEAPSYPDTFLKPTVGWIAGYDLSASNGSAKVYDGQGPHKHADRAVVLHVSWEGDHLARLDIVNPFHPGAGDVLTFEMEGFTQTHCYVNGVSTPLADYLREKGLAEGKLPLIGDYAGARINVSIQSVDSDSGAVTFYAPVFPGVDYRVADAIADYPAAFREAIAAKPSDGVFWSCNCILNFLFGELEGKAIGGVAGPVTFGEIAYQLLNQTMVTVRRI